MGDRGPNSSESSANAGKQVQAWDSETPSEAPSSEITRIPDDLLKNNPKAYKPVTVSLGHFHFGESDLHKFEQIKDELHRRRFPYRSNSDFQKLVERMTDDQFTSRICQWYHLKPSDSDLGGLGRMMALDGIFLLQVLREISPLSEFERYLSLMEIDPFADPERMLELEKNATRSFQLLVQPLRVQKDIMKLQNQIPLFALDKIIQWEKETYQDMKQRYQGAEKDQMLQQKAGKEKNKIYDQQKAGAEKDQMLQDMMLQVRTGTNQDLNSILKKALNSLSPFPDMHADRDDSVIFTGESSHILGFVYRNIIGSSHSTDRTQSSEMGKNKNILPARAVVLDNKGVKFAALKGPFDKIRFDGKTGTFHLPRIEIDNRTDAVMRNLVAFELLVHHDQMKPIKCYVELMDQLINTAEDVEVLKKRGIIQHHLGTDQEVADIWNKMREGLEQYQKDKYGPIDTAIDEVIKFYGSYKIWFAEGVKMFFSKPWLVVSLIVGCVFLVTSIMQTILAWQQVHH